MELEVFSPLVQVNGKSRGDSIISMEPVLFQGIFQGSGYGVYFKYKTNLSCTF